MKNETTQFSGARNGGSDKSEPTGAPVQEAEKGLRSSQASLELDYLIIALERVWHYANHGRSSPAHPRRMADRADLLRR